MCKKLITIPVDGRTPDMNALATVEDGHRRRNTRSITGLQVSEGRCVRLGLING